MRRATADRALLDPDQIAVRRFPDDFGVPPRDARSRSCPHFTGGGRAAADPRAASRRPAAHLLLTDHTVRGCPLAPRSATRSCRAFRSKHCAWRKAPRPSCCDHRMQRTSTFVAHTGTRSRSATGDPDRSAWGACACAIRAASRAPFSAGGCLRRCHRDDIRNRIIVLDEVPSVTDQLSTPVTPSVAGVEIHAHVL